MLKKAKILIGLFTLGLILVQFSIVIAYAAPKKTPTPIPTAAPIINQYGEPVYGMEHEIIVSESFEKDLGDFKSRNIVEKMALSTKEKAHSGKSSLMIKGRKYNYSGVSLELTKILKAGTEYYITGYIKAKADDTVNVAIECRQKGKAYSTIYSLSSFKVKKNKWYKFDLNYLAKAGMSSNKLFIETFNTKCDLYIDDFSISYPTVSKNIKKENKNFSFIPQKQSFEKTVNGNPLRGFYPFSWWRDQTKYIPYSLEMKYFALKDFYDKDNKFSFTYFDKFIQDVADRGNQMVLRVFLDYPGEVDGVPQFIWDMGVGGYPYSAPFGSGIAPDYSDQRLIDELVKFIKEFGKRYDGDPRIGFIQIGLIGHWGEWHNFPDNSPMPSPMQQEHIVKAYTNAFTKTRLMGRYPNMGNMAAYDVGFHDDSFMIDSFLSEPWSFIERLKASDTMDRWRTNPIGGEFCPPTGPLVDDALFWMTEDSKYDDFYTCADTFKPSVLSMTFAFQDDLTEREKKLLNEISNYIGYEFYLSDVKLNNKSGKTGEQTSVDVEISNKGLAPFYYPWQVWLGIVSDGRLIKTIPVDWDIGKIMPGSYEIYHADINLSMLLSGNYDLVLQIENPLKNGKQLKFANEAQDMSLLNWVTCGSIIIK